MDNFQATSKLSLIENQRKQQQQQQQPSSLASNLKRNKILIKTFFSLIILLAFITGAMIINLIHRHNKSQEKLKLDRQTESLRGFCSVTRFPDHCLNSVILLPDNSPDDIFIASLDLAVERVVNFTVLTRALILQSSSDAATESRNESALFRCSSLIDDSLNRLNRSLTASGESSLFGLRVDSGEMEELVREKIKEVRSWVNQAASDLRRCFGILGEDNSTAVIELRSGVYDGIMHVSNIFDFLECRDRIVDDIKARRERHEYYIPPRDDLEYIIIFSPQYFVLIFLLWLLLRIY